MISTVILALTASLHFSLGIRIWDTKYIESVGLVPRLNVVGVPSEARSLYVVDNDISQADGDSPVRHKRGLLDYFTSRPRPVYYPVGVASPAYTVTRPASGGSRYGQPSLLASSGSLSPSTSSATLSVSPWVTVPDTGLSGSRYGQPSLLASSGSLTSNTKTASLSITPGQGSVSGSRYGQPSLLAASGALSPQTTSAKLSVRPVRRK